MQKKLTEHVPVVNWRNRHIIVSIVGCGGTGSHIATGMPYCIRHYLPLDILTDCGCS